MNTIHSPQGTITISDNGVTSEIVQQLIQSNNESKSSLVNPDEIIKYGYKLYNEYVTFMGVLGSYMPKEIVIRFGGNYDKTTSGANIFYNQTLKKYTVNLHGLQMCSKERITQLLYHEFTHIFDSCCLNSNKKDMSDREVLRWYTEYHAAEIEMMKVLGFKCVYEKMKLEKSDSVFSDGVIKSLLDFIDDVNHELHILLKTIKDELIKKGGCIDSGDVLSIFNGIMHCKGKLDCIYNHLDGDEKNPNRLIDYLNPFIEQGLVTFDSETKKLFSEFDSCIPSTRAQKYHFDLLVYKICYKLTNGLLEREEKEQELNPSFALTILNETVEKMSPDGKIDHNAANKLRIVLRGTGERFSDFVHYIEDDDEYIFDAVKWRCRLVDGKKTFEKVRVPQEVHNDDMED